MDVNSSSATPIPQKILTQGGKTPDCNGLNPSNQIISGGFAWLAPTGPGPCQVNVTAGPESDLSTWAQTSTGASIPAGCGFLFDATSPNSVLNKTVPLPVYNDVAKTPPTPDPTAAGGKNSWYHVEKWAGFHVLGWSFPSNTVGPAVWGPGENGIYGYFIGFSADPSSFGDFTTDPNSTGNVYVVSLTQ
jgi:hypothetical protein